ncbi:helix-turn-helix transcriptional regulator [bacterium]|nr:helix-turn-helix transcriptional regulator [bacterium]
MRKRKESTKKLSEREQNVLMCVLKGMTNIEIGKTMVISPHTAKAHLSSALKKINCKNRLCFVLKALKMGIITLEDIHIEDFNRKDNY